MRWRKATVASRARGVQPKAWEFRARRLNQRSAASASTSIASGRSKPREIDSQIRLHCLSLLALRRQRRTKSVAVPSPDCADSSAYAEKSASFPPVTSRLWSSYAWRARFRERGLRRSQASKCSTPGVIEDPGSPRLTERSHAEGRIDRRKHQAESV